LLADGAISSSFEAAHRTLIDWGINLSLKRIERLTYCFGKIGLSLRESKIFNLNIGNLLPGNTLKGEVCRGEPPHGELHVSG
jgi:hypothetical protein